LEETREIFFKVSGNTEKLIEALKKIEKCVEDLDTSIDIFNETALELKIEKQKKDDEI
jgi:methyl coenzyme M reductase beta subunit